MLARRILSDEVGAVEEYSIDFDRIVWLRAEEAMSSDNGRDCKRVAFADNTYGDSPVYHNLRRRRNQKYSVVVVFRFINRLVLLRDRNVIMLDSSIGDSYMRRECRDELGEFGHDRCCKDVELLFTQNKFGVKMRKVLKL